MSEQIPKQATSNATVVVNGSTNIGGPPSISENNATAKKKLQGLYIDIIEDSSKTNSGEMVQTLSFVLRLSSACGVTQRVAEVSQVLKKGSSIRLLYDWDDKTLAIFQYDRENPLDIITSFWTEDRSRIFLTDNFSSIIRLNFFIANLNMTYALIDRGIANRFFNIEVMKGIIHIFSYFSI